MLLSRASPSGALISRSTFQSDCGADSYNLTLTLRLANQGRYRGRLGEREARVYQLARVHKEVDKFSRGHRTKNQCIVTLSLFLLHAASPEGDRTGLCRSRPRMHHELTDFCVRSRSIQFHVLACSLSNPKSAAATPGGPRSAQSTQCYIRYKAGQPAGQRCGADQRGRLPATSLDAPTAR